MAEGTRGGWRAGESLPAEAGDGNRGGWRAGEPRRCTAGLRATFSQRDFGTSPTRSDHFRAKPFDKLRPRARRGEPNDGSQVPNGERVDADPWERRHPCRREGVRRDYAKPRSAILAKMALRERDEARRQILPAASSRSDAGAVPTGAGWKPRATFSQRDFETSPTRSDHFRARAAFLKVEIPKKRAKVDLS